MTIYSGFSFSIVMLVYQRVTDLSNTQWGQKQRLSWLRLNTNPPIPIFVDDQTNVTRPGKPTKSY